MRYHALATDYDGTLALHGRVNAETVATLKRFRASGRKLLLVTGRELDELLGIFPEIHLFDLVVAENGGLLYRPANGEEKKLAESPPETFIMALRGRGVAPMSVGRVIVATWRPHETAVLAAIQDLGLELQVIFNKDAVMVLPAGVNKASGLAVALKELQLSAHEVVAVGDAENDHAFLSYCEFGVAVANALPALKDHADLVTPGDHGTGVCQLMDRILADDLRSLEDRLTRHNLLLGTSEEGAEVQVAANGPGVLITGTSESSNSPAAKVLLHRLIEKHYQFCLLSPNENYEGLEGAITLGNNQHGASVEEILGILENPGQNAVVNLLGHPRTDQPTFFRELYPRLQELHARTGRPHWLILDEAHHLLPTSGGARPFFPPNLDRSILLTTHPEQVLPAVLTSVGTVLVSENSPVDMLHQICLAMNASLPTLPPLTLEAGEILCWPKSQGQTPFRMRLSPLH